MANSDGALAPVPGPDEEEDRATAEDQAVDVDLDELDEGLRAEAIGKSTTVRIGGKIIHIIHAGDWSSQAMRAATNGDWDAWAREVILDDAEYGAWMDSNLRNYQIEAVFDQCGRQARMNMGKSRRRSGSSRASRRR